MQELLSEDIIKTELVPLLSIGKRGDKTKVSYYQIVSLILYKLKTGCQWSYLPIKSFIRDINYTYHGIFYHFRKWTRDDSWYRVWSCLLNKYGKHLDMSHISIDGSHTICKKGGEEVSYQGRKKAKKTNLRLICSITPNK